MGGGASTLPAGTRAKLSAARVVARFLVLLLLARVTWIAMKERSLMPGSPVVLALVATTAYAGFWQSLEADAYMVLQLLLGGCMMLLLDIVLSGTSSAQSSSALWWLLHLILAYYLVAILRACCCRSQAPARGGSLAATSAAARTSVLFDACAALLPLGVVGLMANALLAYHASGGLGEFAQPDRLGPRIFRLYKRISKDPELAWLTAGINDFGQSHVFVATAALLGGERSRSARDHARQYLAQQTPLLQQSASKLRLGRDYQHVKKFLPYGAPTFYEMVNARASSLALAWRADRSRDSFRVEKDKCDMYEVPGRLLRPLAPIAFAVPHSSPVAA